MIIFPAIDLKDKKVVRLLKGNYNKMTVYGDDPVLMAKQFEESGAEYLHVVDLDGAKDGNTPNFDVVEQIVKQTNLKVEIGGGIRNEEGISKYIEIGVFRVILGTVAVENPQFTYNMIKRYEDKIAVGIDILEGYVAVKGWTEVSKVSCDEMFLKLQEQGVHTVICTDISKDGAMKGTNRKLYESLSVKYNMNIVASGGISNIEDVTALKKLNIHGAILGKSLYVGTIDLKNAIEVAK